VSATAHGSRVASVGVLVVLVASLIAGLAPNADTRLVGIGEALWPGYASELRVDPQPPECDPAELRARAATCPAPGGSAAPAAPPADDPFADPPAAAPPADDPFADPPAAAPPADDPFADPPAAAPPADDPFADAPAAPPADAACAALPALIERCDARHAAYDHVATRITGAVRAFRAVETAVSEVARFPYWRHMLSIVLVLAGFNAARTRNHLALRAATTTGDHRVVEVAQIGALMLMIASALADAAVQAASSAEREDPGLPALWVLGFSGVALAHLYAVVRPPADLAPGAPTPRALLAVPLYVWMVVLSSAWFLGVEQHPSGLAIQLHKFIQYPSIYLGIGLYLWSGMLLGETRVAARVFDVVTPWGLPPGLLAWLVVVLAAVPTAYSGASGIFVLAAGGVVYERLRAAGTDRQLSLAATAMSGSLGVVLNPCLVVVLIAVLNKQVTTSELFAHGRWVFVLTAVLSAIAFVAATGGALRPRPTAGAAAATRAALVALVPFVAVAAGVLIAYRVVLATSVNEYTAALVLPGLMLAVLAYDRAGDGVLGRVVRATDATSVHAGGLLFLMASSVGLGGVVERADLMRFMPDLGGSPVVTMVALVLVMVLIGMTMDAMGAVVLVSVTFAGVAYNAGIDPVHFWMMVLVAFELGYLTPPVALNQILARHAAGADGAPEPGQGLVARTLHLWLPVSVMTTALLIVAFVPFFF
jgi:TRAP-type C4-dicarboxylate transport system permease large subunit